MLLIASNSSSIRAGKICGRSEADQPHSIHFAQFAAIPHGWVIAHELVAGPDTKLKAGAVKPMVSGVRWGRGEYGGHKLTPRSDMHILERPVDLTEVMVA